MGIGYRLRRLPWRLTRQILPDLASRWRRLYTRLTHLHADVRFEGPVYLGPGFSLLIPDRGSLQVGPGVQFRRGFRCEIEGDGKVVIGEGCIFTHDVVIQCSTLVEIGARCMFGQATLIVDGNHRFRDPERPMLEQGYDFREIHIADDVTVTTKCTIIADIGEHAYIGANSVVTRDIPPYSLAAGAPAKPIETFGPGDGEAGIPAGVSDPA